VDKVVIEQGFLQVLWFSRQNHSARAPHTHFSNYSDYYYIKKQVYSTDSVSKSSCYTTAWSNLFPCLTSSSHTAQRDLPCPSEGTRKFWM